MHRGATPDLALTASSENPGIAWSRIGSIKRRQHRVPGRKMIADVDIEHHLRYVWRTPLHHVIEVYNSEMKRSNAYKCLVKSLNTWC